MSLVLALTAWVPIMTAAFAFTVFLLQIRRLEGHAYQGLLSNKGPTYTGVLLDNVRAPQRNAEC